MDADGVVVDACQHDKGKTLEESPLHSCPYRDDVLGDADPEYCRCCALCEADCRDDI